MNPKEKVQELLSLAGATINGPNPYDPQVYDERLYGRILAGGSLALGEAYMDGWWDTEDLAEFFNKILRAQLDKRVNPFSLLLHSLKARVMNRQSRSRATQVAKEHYDLGNDLYQAMLDKSTLSYTCAYCDGCDTLEAAQEQKLDLLCRKIDLKQGEHVLDIGCGFGGFAKYAAEKYGVRVTGISVSKQQIELARERTKGLPVEIRFEDYRDTKGQFDHIVSIEMIEAVGHKNFRTFFKKAHELLKPGGFFGLQAIVGYESDVTTEPWIDKYIFPNGMLPSIKQIGHAIENLFVAEDWHNFGADYDRTLTQWFNNFNSAWPELKEKYNERFYRMWKYYLLCCAGSFRARNNQLFQVVLSKGGVDGVYQAVR